MGMTPSAASSPAAWPAIRLALWGTMLGFALGGFFDGILLHQILQWHHLLSLVPGVMDLRLQVLFDGWFHAAMYIVATLALIGLWRSARPATDAPWRRLADTLLIGFGLWHLVDAVLSHWLLGVHRIKLDSDIPLAWDIGWALAFGLLPVVIGWRLVRRPPDAPGAQSVRPTLRPSAMLMLLAAATAAAGGLALRPPPGQAFTTIVFAPDRKPAAVMAAIAELDGRLVWSDAAMGVVVVDVAEGRRLGFYARGALLVSGTGLAGGCFGWSAA